MALGLSTGLGEKRISEGLRVPENHSESTGKELIALIQKCIFFSCVDLDYLVFYFYFFNFCEIRELKVWLITATQSASIFQT